jgi:hypothetical protein
MEAPMWPWTVEENEFVSEIKKNSDSLINKMKNITSDLVDVHIDTTTKLFELTNKHSGNMFSVFEPAYKRQVDEYRNVVRSYCK